MPRPGDRIATYVIERPLGAGGMGEVYLAFDDKLERRVALKLLPTARALDRAARLRMLREARAASALRHPGIVTIYDVEESDGRTYIAMEYVDGDTFADLVARRGRVPPAEAVDLVARVADALDAAHSAGVLHRDVKSANLMLDARGAVKVLDFGLSKRTGAASSAAPSPVPRSFVTPSEPETVDDSPGRPVAAVAPTELPADPAGPPELDVDPHGATHGSASGNFEVVTVHGARMGTPGWAALELLEGEVATERSDVFSLGVVLYHLVSGELPFDGATWDALRGQQTRNAPRPSGAGPRLDAVLARALAPHAADRFATCGELAAAARGALAPARWPRRAALGGGAAAVAVGALWIAVPSRGTSTPAASAPPPDAAPAPAFSPGALTSMGGCAYSPAFVDEATIVFDHTLGDAVDVYRLALGSAPERLTTSPSWEWRANPGATPGEIVYVVSDIKSGVDSRLAARDLATGVERTLTRETSPAVTSAGGAYYYASNDGATIRRVAGGRDERALSMGDGFAEILVASHDGTRLASIGESTTSHAQLCLLDLAGAAVKCSEPRRLESGRPAFAADDRALYYAERDGIVRVAIDGIAVTGEPESILPGVQAAGGIAVSPSGKLLIYSDCYPRGPLRDVSVDPPVAIASDDIVGEATAGRDGTIAYARRGRELVLRSTDGFLHVIAGPTPTGTTIRKPALSPDGGHVAVSMVGPEHGLHVVQTGRVRPSTRLTDGEADDNAAWLGPDEILFNRWDKSVAHVFRVKLDGSPAREATPDSRVVVGVSPLTGDALLSSADETHLYWWDPRTGTQRPGPPALAPGFRDVYHHSLSPDGRWLGLQLGREGHVFLRVALDERGDAVGAAELVWEAPGGATVNNALITAEGHLIVSALEWVGEIRAIALRP